MLSATPVNNRFTDLRNQLALAYEGDSAQLAAKLDISTSDRGGVPRRPSGCSTSGRSCPPRSARPTRSWRVLDFDFFELLDAVTIARSRKHIQAFYDTADIGAFPERLKPESRSGQPLTDLPDAPTFNEIFEQLQLLNAGRLHAAGLRVPEPAATSTSSCTATSQGGTRGGSGEPRAAGREQGIQKLMTVNLLKRLESSVEAFRLTLGRLEAAVDRGARRPSTTTPAHRRHRLPPFADVDADDDDFELPTSAHGRPEGPDRPGRHGRRVVATRPRERPRVIRELLAAMRARHARARPQAPARCAT